METIQSFLMKLLTKIKAMDLWISTLGKQIEVTQGNVDAISHHQADTAAAPTGSVIREQGTTSTTRSVPRRPHVCDIVNPSTGTNIRLYFSMIFPMQNSLSNFTLDLHYTLYAGRSAHDYYK